MKTVQEIIQAINENKINEFPSYPEQILDKALTQAEATGLAQAFSRNQTFVRLDLGELNLKNLSEAEVQTVIKELLTSLKQNPASIVEYLDFTNIKLSDEVVQLLAELIAMPSRIQTLGLSRCGITDQQATVLACACKTNQTLTLINLSFNEIADEGVKVFVSVLNQSGNKIETLFLDKNSAITEIGINCLHSTLTDRVDNNGRPLEFGLGERMTSYQNQVGGPKAATLFREMKELSAKLAQQASFPSPGL